MKYLLIFLAFIMVMGFASADLGEFQKDTCVQIRALGNCSLTLGEVTSPTTTYKINSAMTNLAGQTYNYSFCNTSELGTYTYSWSGSCLDCGLDGCGNSFVIGTNNIGFYVIVIIVIYGISFIGFFGRNEWVTMFGGMGMLALGIYTINNGIIIYEDFITNIFSWTTIGLGAFFSLFTGISLIQETYN